MVKYKLIKEYPGSPKLGTIVSHYMDNYWSQDLPIPEYIKDADKFPEFWEEIIEKDYEILSFEDTSNKNVDWEKTGGNEYTHSSGELCNLEDLLYSNHWKIHSVKRLSDGEIFTVGDNCEYGVLTGFILNKLQSCEEVCISQTNTSNYSCNIQFLKKIRQPLFTTEDGVNIFDDNTEVYLTNTWIYPIPCKVKYGNRFKDSMYKLFFTKEAAEEYVLMNKPCLSINDIDTTAISKAGITRLKQIVKSRL